MRKLFIIIALTFSRSMAQDAFFVMLASQRYHPESWPTTPSACGVVTNLVPQLSNDVFVQSAVITNIEKSLAFQSYRYRVNPNSGGTIHDLRVSILPNYTTACNALLEQLGMMESPVLIPYGTNGLEAVGDICLSTSSPESAGMTLFVRNNVFVYCRSSFDYSLVTNSLYSLDAQIIGSLSSE